MWKKDLYLLNTSAKRCVESSVSSQRLISMSEAAVCARLFVQRASVCVMKVLNKNFSGWMLTIVLLVTATDIREYPCSINLL